VQTFGVRLISFNKLAAPQGRIRQVGLSATALYSRRGGKSSWLD
jgi:hypothetical protein